MSKQPFTALPAHQYLPGTVVFQDGAVFSAVFRGCRSCGLILYHLPDLQQYEVPFTDEYRYGSLYSVMISGLNPDEWAYRYYRDDCTFEDPYARELQTVRTKKGQLTLCRLFPFAEDNMPSYGNRPIRPWGDQLIYLMHVRGFTASKDSKVRGRGTFHAATSKIPYLKELGVTAIELMPVYELRPARLEQPMHSEEKSRGAAYVPAILPSREEKVNYWNFGEGCYFAPKRAYAGSDRPQQEFRDMVSSFHKAGMEVYLQLYFPATVSMQTQLETVRFYVTHYQIDGFHIKGDNPSVNAIAAEPMMANTSIFYYSFPYEDLQKTEDREFPTGGRPQITHLAEYRDDFAYLARRYIKSDNNVIRDFIQSFTHVPTGHGNVHYITSYEGFTLNDLVSYNWKHNEANGEDNHDGSDDNCSWNCGFEGKTQRKEIRTLRNRQMRNFMLVNMLAQGTPMLYQGDERCNTQNGNNNPYCQDNETGWMNWRTTKDSLRLLDFTRKIIAFRKEHECFRRRAPFKCNDYKVVGYPDLSFHGKDAWKADFGNYSHTIGVMYCEDYNEEHPSHDLIYLAMNMHWHNQQLGLPTPPEGYHWEIILDTFEDEPFLKEPVKLDDPRHTFVRGRSIQILTTAVNKPAKHPVAIVSGTVTG